MSHAQQKITALFDISSGSVGGALVSFSNDGPRVLYTVRKYFDRGQRKSAHELLIAMEQTVLLVGQLLLKASPTPCSTISCFYSSPWAFSKTKTIHIKNKKKFTVSKAIINKAIELEEKELKENDGLNMTLVQRHVFSIRVNGYKTHEPLNKKTDSLDATVAMVFVPTDIIKRIDHAIETALGYMPVQHFGFEIAACSSLRALHIIPEDCIFIHTHHRITDMVIIHKGDPFEIISYPVGHHDVLYSSSKTDSIAIEESRHRMHHEGVLHEEESTRVHHSMTNPLMTWITPLKDFLFRVSSHIHVPSSLYIVAETPLWYSLIHAFKKSDIAHFVFRGHDIDLKRLSTKEEWAPRYELGIRQDIHISLATLYLVTNQNQEYTQ